MDTVEVDKDAGHIIIIRDGVRSGQTIRWKDCVISAPSNGNLKIDLAYINESGQLVLVLEDNTEIILTAEAFDQSLNTTDNVKFSEVRLTPKASSAGPEGTIFYSSVDKCFYGGVEA